MPAQLFEGVAGDSVVGLEEIYNLAAYGIGRRYIPFTKYPDMLELCVLGHYCRRSIKVWTNQGVFNGDRYWRWLNVYENNRTPAGGEICLMGCNDVNGFLIHYNWLSQVGGPGGQQSV